MKRKTLSAEHRAKIAAAMRGRKLTAKHKAKIGVGVAGKKLTPKERAERKKAVQLAWAKSPAGQEWIKKNQAKKNAARKAWRERMRAAGKVPS